MYQVFTTADHDLFDTHGLNCSQSDSLDDPFRRIRFLIQILKQTDPKHEENNDIHLLTKAIKLVSRYHTKNWRDKKLLYFSGILEILIPIFALKEMSTTREAANLCYSILRNPEEMILWFKF